MMRSSGYNRFGVLMGTSWPASVHARTDCKGDFSPMITLILLQRAFCATATAVMVLLHWETLYCLHQHGQGDGQPCNTGRVMQHSCSHGEPQAYGKGWGSREALSYGTAYDGLDADRAIFESAVRTLAEGNTLRATARIVQVDEHAAVGVAGF